MYFSCPITKQWSGVLASLHPFSLVTCLRIIHLHTSTKHESPVTVAIVHFSEILGDFISLDTTPSRYTCSLLWGEEEVCSCNTKKKRRKPLILAIPVCVSGQTVAICIRPVKGVWPKTGLVWPTSVSFTCAVVVYAKNHSTEFSTGRNSNRPYAVFLPSFSPSRRPVEKKGETVSWWAFLFLPLVDSRFPAPPSFPIFNYVLFFPSRLIFSFVLVARICVPNATQNLGQLPVRLLSLILYLCHSSMGWFGRCFKTRTRTKVHYGKLCRKMVKIQFLKWPFWNI